MREFYNVELYFEKGYIADPYWPELEELINIQKSSGMNRARSQEKRDEALKAYLLRIGMTMNDYRELEGLAQRPWYRENLSDDDSAEIIMTSHQLYGCLIAAAKGCSTTIRPCEPQNLRHVLNLSDFHTGKYHSDGVYKRLVQPKTGTGQPLSNQRMLRMNPYICEFSAKGKLSFFSEDLKEEGIYLQDFLNYAGQRTGVGASRKMGWGRYEVKSFERSL